jgi:hypothetical protein
VKGFAQIARKRLAAAQPSVACQTSASQSPQKPNGNTANSIKSFAIKTLTVEANAKRTRFSKEIDIAPFAYHIT